MASWQGKGDNGRNKFSLPYERWTFRYHLLPEGEMDRENLANKVLFENGDVLDTKDLDPHLLKPLLRW